MSKKRVEQVVQDSDKKSQEEEDLNLKSQPEPEIRAGYVVAVNEKGNFIFDVIGKDKGLIELLGLHQYASERIRQIVNVNTGTGDKLVQQLGAVVLELNNKLDRLLLATLPPQNKL